MGCKYACTCAGNCLNCSSYEPEEYYGQAEDLLAQDHGFRDADEWDDFETLEEERCEKKIWKNDKWWRIK